MLAVYVITLASPDEQQRGFSFKPRSVYRSNPKNLDVRYLTYKSNKIFIVTLDINTLEDPDQTIWLDTEHSAFDPLVINSKSK